MEATRPRAQRGNGSRAPGVAPQELVQCSIFTLHDSLIGIRSDLICYESELISLLVIASDWQLQLFQVNNLFAGYLHYYCIDRLTDNAYGQSHHSQIQYRTPYSVHVFGLPNLDVLNRDTPRRRRATDPGAPLVLIRAESIIDA